MGKFITVIARFFASIFALFFVVTTILALIFYGIYQQMFNAALYKNVLIEQKIYEHLPEIVGVALMSSFSSSPCTQNPLVCSIDGASPELQVCLTTALGSSAYQEIGSGQRSSTEAELVLAQPCLEKYSTPQTDFSQPGKIDPDGGSGIPSYFQNLTAADWQAMLAISLPGDDLRTMTESMLDQMVAYLNGEMDSINVPLDKLKERLMGPAGADLIMQLINSQPACTAQDLMQMASGTINGNMILFLCKPPEDMVPIIAFLLPEILKSVVPQIPDVAIIIKPPAPGGPAPGTGPFGADLITTIRTIRLIMRLSPLVPLIFLLGITLFAVRSLTSWMRWWGIPIFISGTMALGLGILTQPVLDMAWTMVIVPQIPPIIPTGISNIGLDLLNSIVHSIANGMVLWVVIFLGFGLAAWIGSFFIKQKIV
jgi:hypothetical protein